MGDLCLKKLLINGFYYFLAVVIIIVVLLVNHYSLWIALFNSIVFVIVGVLLDHLEQIINRNRNRDFPRWFSALIFGIFIFIISIFKSNFSNIELLWFWIVTAFIVKIIFPIKTDS